MSDRSGYPDSDLIPEWELTDELGPDADASDVLAEAAAAGHDDPNPTPVQLGDPDWVEPAQEAVPAPGIRPGEPEEA